MTSLLVRELVILSAGCSHACICPGPCHVDSAQLYAVFRGDDLDTRLLRAMVIKGILEQITTSTVNLVNADLLAKTRGLRIIESTVPSEGRLAPFIHPLFTPIGETSCCVVSQPSALAAVLPYADTRH